MPARVGEDPRHAASNVECPTGGGWVGRANSPRTDPFATVSFGAGSGAALWLAVWCVVGATVGPVDGNVALCLGLLSGVLQVAAIVFGRRAIRRIHDSDGRARGRLLAHIGTLLGWAGLVFWLLLAVVVVSFVNQFSSGE